MITQGFKVSRSHDGDFVRTDVFELKDTDASTRRLRIVVALVNVQRSSKGNLHPDISINVNRQQSTYRDLLRNSRLVSTEITQYCFKVILLLSARDWCKELIS